MTQSLETTAQADRPPRLTLRGFADSVQREAFDVDRGLLGTWLQLWRRPGTTLRRYIQWRESRLTPPVRYAIICLALSALLLQWFDISPDLKIGFQRGLSDSQQGSEPLPAWFGMVSEHLHWWLYLVAVPAMGAAVHSRYGDRINLAEALAIATYALAQLSLGISLLMVLASELLGYAGALPMLLLPIYFALVCYGYFVPDGYGLRRAVGTTVLMLSCLMLFTVSVGFIVLGLGYVIG